MRSSALALVLILVFAAPAFAQGPSQDGYSPEGPQVLERTGGGGSDPTANTSDGDDPTATEGSLPFTGVDLLMVAGIGAGLLGVGAGMRRLTRPPDRLAS